jgi:hypothetical protein
VGLGKRGRVQRSPQILFSKTRKVRGGSFAENSQGLKVLFTFLQPFWMVSWVKKIKKLDIWNFFLKL